MTDVSELARASQTGELDQAITQLEKAGQGGGMPEDGPDAHALAMIRYGASSFAWNTFSSGTGKVFQECSRDT